MRRIALALTIMALILALALALALRLPARVAGDSCASVNFSRDCAAGSEYPYPDPHRPTAVILP